MKFSMISIEFLIILNEITENFLMKFHIILIKFSTELKSNMVTNKITYRF